MANDTKCSSKSKDDENSSSKKKSVAGKGSPILRRSSRTIPSQKQVSQSPSTARKSERLEKRKPTETPVKRKLGMDETKRTPSPLRRSERGKNSSGSKKADTSSGASDAERIKLKSKNSVKQLTHEAVELSTRGKQNPRLVGGKMKRMNARTYMSAFKKLQGRETVPDSNEELERPDKLSQVSRSYSKDSLSKQAEDREGGDEECRKGVGEESFERASKKGKERSQPWLRELDAVALCSHGEVQVSCSSQGHSYMGADPKVATKRRRCTVEIGCKASTTFASKDTLNPFADVVSPPSSECKRDNFAGPCVTCSERQRADYDSPVQELCFCNTTPNKDLHSTSISKDRGELQASVQGLIDKNDGIAQSKESLLDVQIDGQQNICVICKLGGKLLCCCGKGCKRSYHLSCLDPPLEDVSPGDWHCFSCVKKKIESSVYSVSEGVESIWDAREVGRPYTEGQRKQKQYFVKYKGLAHVHNQWVPETQLLLDAPLLIAKFNRKNQVLKWVEEWRVPHRLLKKRLLLSPKQGAEYRSEHAGDTSDCHYEWLVKWRGLDYEHATWELKSASFLRSPHALGLIREYENRHKWTKRDVSFSLVEKSKTGFLVKLSKLPHGVSLENYHDKLDSVNKLREYWDKGQNAIVINDQERVLKMILFVMSLVSNVTQPFLVISNSNLLSVWEAEFLRLSPSTNVVVYGGNKHNRRIIRTFDFYDEGGCVMFQVLLSSVEAIVEDLEVIQCLGWEAVIVDECQHIRISKHFEQLKMLTTKVRVLLFNGQIKDGIAEHLNLLSLLDSLSDLDSSKGLMTKSNDNLGRLKERLSEFIVYHCKSDSRRFLEYWVPVGITNVQLEQYCATLLSNSTALRSCSRNDPVGALRDILISTRKCCDHPYIVDPLLQELLTKGLQEAEYLDLGIKASGKLQLLDIILSEIKNRGLRVVIIFQSIGGSGRDSIGDILEDFLRQRFGSDSYERVDGGILPPKKQAAVNQFNDKGSGRFVFLLENRACLPSIKLSSVDTVIIFDSDWYPANDLRAVQRISFDPTSEQIKIFRLYTSCTVEEKVLDLATHDVSLDSNLRSISRSGSHMLLMWGASYLFSKLDEFHGGNTSTSVANISSELSLVKDVAKEFLALLGQDDEDAYKNNSLIIKALNGGSGYTKTGSLHGELKIQLADVEPHVFWTKLMEGRNPRWRYPSGPLQRNRKRIRYFDDTPKMSEGKTVDDRKKLKKDVIISADPASLQPKVNKGELPGGKQVHTVESEEGIRLRDVQKSHHILLKPEISKLCEILQLSEDVKVMAGRFLDYVVDNHRVNTEPETILQAFQISLCWIAASLLKCKVEKKESLALAKKHLNFCCSEEQAKQVYLKLRILKKIYLQTVGYFNKSESSKDPIAADDDSLKEISDARLSKFEGFSQQKVIVEIEQRLENQKFAEDPLLPQKEQAPKHKLEGNDFSKQIKRIKRKCEKRMKKLLLKQQEETREFYRNWKEENAQLEKEHRLDSDVVRSIHSNIPLRLYKLKKLDDEFVKKTEEHKRKKDIRLKELKAKQLAETISERQKADRWLEEVNSCSKVELSGQLPPHGSKFDGTSEHGVQSCPVNVPSVLECPVEARIPNGVQATEVASADIPRAAASRKAADCGVTIGSQRSQLHGNHETNAVDFMASDRVSMSGFEKLSNVQFFAGDPENHNLVNPPVSAEQIPDGDCPSEQEVPENAPNELADGADFADTVNPDVLTNEKHNQRDGFDVSVEDISNNAVHDIIVNTNNAAVNSVNVGALSVETCSINSPLVQPVVTSAQSGSSPQNLDLCSQASAPIGMNDGDGPVSVDGNRPEQVEVPALHPFDAGPTDQTNPGEVVIEQAELLQLSLCTDSHVYRSQLDSHADAGVEHQPSEENTAPQSLEGTQQFEDLAEPSNQAVLQPGADLAPPPTHTADAGPTDHTNLAELMIDQAEQLELSPSTDSPVDHNQPDSHVDGGVEQPPSEENTAPHSVQGTQQFQDLAEPSNQAVLQPEADLTRPPIHTVDVPLGQSQPDLHLAVGNALSSDGCSSFQNAEFSSQLVEDTALVRNQVYPGTQLEMHPPAETPLVMHLPLHRAPQVASRMPSQPLYGDALQNELERLRKEIEDTIKAHDDMKLQLNSDCNKEIAEIIAEIRRKYETKLQEAEAAFLLKKEELDINHNKVLMNKILAEAFRSKCLDIRPSGALGMQQVMPSSIMQQSHMLSSQPAPRHSSISSLPSVVPAAASQQATAPTVQVVHHASALLSRMTTRPPHIAPVTRPAGNPLALGEMRAPAPHLQSFRPSSSMSGTSISSLPWGLPNQQAQRNHPTTSNQQVQRNHPTISNLQAHRNHSTITNQQAQRNHPTTSLLVPQVPARQRPPPPAPTHHSGSDGAPLPQVTRGQPQVSAGSPSLQELRGTVENQTGAHSPNILPPLPDFGSNFGSLDLTQFGAPVIGGGGGSVSLARPGVATDIVCLSDDE